MSPKQYKALFGMTHLGSNRLSKTIPETKHDIEIVHMNKIPLLQRSTWMYWYCVVPITVSKEGRSGRDPPGPDRHLLHMLSRLAPPPQIHFRRRHHFPFRRHCHRASFTPRCAVSVVPAWLFPQARFLLDSRQTNLAVNTLRCKIRKKLRIFIQKP